jgi:phage tail sheath gpL-like
MRTLGKMLVVALSLGSLTMLPGCILVAAAAVGAAGAAYVNGDLEARLDASPQKIVQASESALKDMEIPVLSHDSTSVDGKVVARTALGKKVDITVKRDGDTSSKISIRIDTFGDEALSRQILEKIKSKL